MEDDDLTEPPSLSVSSADWDTGIQATYHLGGWVEIHRDPLSWKDDIIIPVETDLRRSTSSPEVGAAVAPTVPSTVASFGTSNDSRGYFSDGSISSEESTYSDCLSNESYLSDSSAEWKYAVRDELMKCEDFYHGIDRDQGVCKTFLPMVYRRRSSSSSSFCDGYATTGIAIDTDDYESLSEHSHQMAANSTILHVQDDSSSDRDDGPPLQSTGQRQVNVTAATGELGTNRNDTSRSSVPSSLSHIFSNLAALNVSRVQTGNSNSSTTSSHRDGEITATDEQRAADETVENTREEDALLLRATNLVEWSNRVDQRLNNPDLDETNEFVRLNVERIREGIAQVEQDAGTLLDPNRVRTRLRPAQDLSCAWITPTPITPVRQDHQEMVEVTMNRPTAVATKAINHRTTTAMPVAVNRTTKMVMMEILHPSSISPALVPRGGPSRVS